MTDRTKIVLGDALDFAEFPDDLTKLKHQMVGVRQDIDALVEAGGLSRNDSVATAHRIDAHWRTNMIVQLSTLTLLIDANLVSIEEAAARIEQVQVAFAKGDPGYSTPMAQAIIERATAWLRAHEKKPIREWSADILPFRRPDGEDDK